MSRFWLAFLLLLSLWPAPAGASARAPVPAEHDRDRITVLNSSVQEVARSSGTPELVRALERRVSAGASRLSAARLLAPEAELLLARLRWPAPAAPPPAVAAAAPLCERLPYHATAPPAVR